MNESSQKIFSYTVVAIAVVAIVAGFFFVGSPAEERLRRFDEQRVGYLQTIQSQIVYYWQRKQILPQTLSDLQDNISGFTVPKDPETQANFEYSITNNKNFSLCATFSRASLSQSVNYNSSYPYPAYPEMGGTWNHDAGHVCFERSIDPQLYPPIDKTTQLPATPPPIPVKQ